MHIGALLQIKCMILVMHWIMELIVDCCTRLLDLSHAQILALLFVSIWFMCSSRKKHKDVNILFMQFMSMVRDNIYLEYVQVDN